MGNLNFVLSFFYKLWGFKCQLECSQIGLKDLVIVCYMWDYYGANAQTFKTTIEATCMLLKIDDNMNDTKKKWVLSYGPKQPQIDIEVNVDSEKMIPKWYGGTWNNFLVCLHCFSLKNPLVPCHVTMPLHVILLKCTMRKLTSF